MWSFSDYLKDFLGAPYRGNMTALQWFLFIGLLMIAIVGWRFILQHIRGLTSALTE